ncbi:heat shock protein [Sarcoptes scabiei]|nr:heat shock protein [Sarcoptes scabiei]
MFDEYNFNNVDTMIINEDENYGGEEYEIYDDNFVSKKNLQSFIHVCLYNDQLSEAHAFLMEFVGKFSNSLSSTDIASCCELLMKGMARKGRTENVIELLDFIRNNLNVKPSINAYESYLLSLCKQMKKLTPVSIENVFERMAEDEHNPNTLLERTNLNASEIKLIRKLFESNNIDFGFRSTQIDQNYGIELVDKILEEPQNYYNPFEGIDLSQMDEMIERQFQIEINSVFHLDPVEAKFRDNSLQQSNSYYQETLRKLEARWTDLLSKGFSNYLNRLKQKHKRLNGIPFIHYMTIMETEIYVKAMLEEIQKCASFSEHYSPYSASLFEGLGRRIMQEYLTRSNLMDETYSDFKKCYTQFIKYVMNPKLLMQYNPREYWQFLQKNGYHYYFDESKYWPNNVLQEIGKDLYEIISSEARIDSDILQIEELHRFSQPVITFYYKNHDSFKTKKEVRLNPLLIELYEGSGSSIYLESERMPLLSPPVPWITPNFGGNLLIRSFLVRLPQYYPKHRLKQYPLQDLFPTFDSLNALALCPWKINEKVLDVAIDVFKRGGDKNLDIPVSLAHFGPLPRASSDMCAKEKAMIYYKRKLQKKEQAEEYSLWVDCLYKLSIGNSLRGKYFWFPFNADFRSRVYPIPPNFNHLGNDLSRAILLFGKGKPLGENGLDWLKIHLINLTGLKKKSSIQERLKYADEIIDLIIDSADRPLDGQKWWMSSDEKWQTLACCFELTNALRSPDPHSYVSHMPIHQDGSCNGLQHYAALGRDILGAKSVNLSPSEYPQDVYSDVAALVEKEIEKDIAKGVELAKIIKGFINRKIVKQTVMTYVYGVTRYGAKLQVLKRLKEDPNFPDCHKVNAAVYISEKILFSIQQMFTQTRIIQEWLTDCAQIISTEYNSTVEWITPLGFPVIQSYYRSPKKNSNLVLLPNPMKQKNAFPANFIHSLDSSHMMLTALDCHRHGLTFSSVHDCYWTHACDIDTMNYFCRRQFIALHSEQILRNLAKFLHHKLDQWNETLKLPYHNDLVQHVDRDIPQGEFKLETVKDSVYFFS